METRSPTMAKHKFSAGNPGKPKGAQSKTTKAAKELILLAIDRQTERFDHVMTKLQVEDPKEWARLMVRMFDFVLPRQIDLKSDGEPLKPPIIQLSPPEKDKTQ